MYIKFKKKYMINYVMCQNSVSDVSGFANTTSHHNADKISSSTLKAQNLLKINMYN